MLIFTVTGEPRPQGSKRAFYNKHSGRAMIVEDNTKLRPWRQEVTACAMEAKRAEPDFVKFPRGTPVALHVEFSFLRPADRKYRNAIYKPVKPDIDKLLRGILDALTGVLFEDDSQVAMVLATKCFGEVPGARICIAVCNTVNAAHIRGQAKLFG